jgi:hypothetical protein
MRKDVATAFFGQPTVVCLSLAAGTRCRSDTLDWTMRWHGCIPRLVIAGTLQEARPFTTCGSTMPCQVVCSGAVFKTGSAAQPDRHVHWPLVPPIAALDKDKDDTVEQRCRIRHGSQRARLSKKQLLSVFPRHVRPGCRHGAIAVPHGERGEHTIMAATHGGERVVGSRQKGQVERAGNGRGERGQSERVAAPVGVAGNAADALAAAFEGVGQQLLGVFWPDEEQRLCHRRSRDDAYARGLPRQSASSECAHAAGSVPTSPTRRRRGRALQTPVFFVAVLAGLGHICQQPRPQLERTQLHCWLRP